MIRFDTKKDMEHYDNLYHQIYEKDKEIERLNKELKLKTDFIEELLTLISVARDYELHDKCYTRSRIYQDKLKELKEGDNMKYEIIYNEHTEEIIKDIEETFFSQKHNSQVQIDAEDICHIFGYIKKLEEENKKYKNDEKYITELGFTNIEQLATMYKHIKSKIDNGESNWN